MKKLNRAARVFISLAVCAGMLGSGAVARAADTAGGRLSGSYIYFGSSSAYTGVVDAAQGSLDFVSPNYFTVGAGGALNLTPAASLPFVAAMHDRGIAVIPFLSNGWDRDKGIAALQNRQALAQQLAQYVRSYNLDGVDIDLENLTYAQRADYVDFLRLLRAALPEGKILSVAVAANPYGTNAGWQASYDYAGLARYCDYLEIMAYDEHYQGGPAGPVSSLSFAENSLRYALSVVSPGQIVLALPFYGRIWRDGGGYPQGYGISNAHVDQLVAQYSGSVRYDSASGAVCAVIVIKKSDVKPVIGGTPLTAGTYTIWYENESALKGLISLADKYGVLGATNWSLGQESAGTWDYYGLWLDGCTFSDIQTHWAKNAVFTAWRNGWVKGVSPARYNPEGALTRAQAAVMLVRMLGFSLQADPANAFTDTNEYWAQTEIETARAHGLIDGVGGGRFDPDAPVTREQMAVMLFRLLQPEDPNTACRYSDVDPITNGWSFQAIAALSGTGLFTGFADGSFRPKGILTRAQMAVLLVRLSASFS